jgi:hypothetical protein
MVKKISERKEGWFRILVLIISGVIIKVWGYLIFILGVVNWFITVISGKRNEDIAMFSEYWNSEFYKYVRYLTFVSNERPFPFKSLSRISKFEKNRK